MEQGCATTAVANGRVDAMRRRLESKKSLPFVVAVHAGAGYHAPTNEPALRKAIHDACMAVAKVFCRAIDDEDTPQPYSLCLRAAVEAVTALEQSPVTNAGIGANLSCSGTVELDASVMDSSGVFGAVACVPCKEVNVMRLCCSRSVQRLTLSLECLSHGL